MFYVYVLHCSDDSYYVGHTEDLDIRIAAHQSGFIEGYTSSRRPVRLAWSDWVWTRDEAIARERQIKGWSRAKKEALIRGDWDVLPALARGRARGQKPPAVRPEPVEVADGPEQGMRR